MNKYVKRYLIDAMSGMAQGLFSSLLIGTIIKTLGQQLLRLQVNPIFQFFLIIIFIVQKCTLLYFSNLYISYISNYLM